MAVGEPVATGPGSRWRTSWKRRAVGEDGAEEFCCQTRHGPGGPPTGMKIGKMRQIQVVKKAWQAFIHDAMNPRAVRRCGRVWKTLATHASIARRRQGYDSEIGVGRLFSLDRCCAELCNRGFAWRTFALRAGPGDPGRPAQA